VAFFFAMTVAYSMVRSVRVGWEYDKMRQVARCDCPKMALIHRQEPLNSEAFRGCDDGSIGESHVEVAILNDEFPTPHDVFQGRRDQGEGAALDAIEKVHGGINPQAARQQVVNPGRKDHRQEQWSPFDLDDEFDGGVMGVVGVVHGVNAAGITDQGHSPSFTA